MAMITPFYQPKGSLHIFFCEKRCHGHGCKLQLEVYKVIGVGDHGMDITSNDRKDQCLTKPIIYIGYTKLSGRMVGLGQVKSSYLGDFSFFLLFMEPSLKNKNKYLLI